MSLSDVSSNGNSYPQVLKVATYHALLSSDADLTMPVAAIESLVRALAAHPTSTISETLEYLKSLVETLTASVPNPISLSAGTDLFQRYLISSLQTRQAGSSTDFDMLRRHLINNARLFVQRAKDSRNIIAGFGKNFVRDGCTVLTAGGSRVVGALLKESASRSAVRFRVVYVLGQSETPGARPEGSDTVDALRAQGVPVATIGEGAVAYSLSQVDMVIVGAEGVVENGGAISRLGTYQIGLLAKAHSIPFYVVAESHKFVRLFPLGQYDLPIEQQVVEFKVENEKVVDELAKTVDLTKSSRGKRKLSNGPHAVDFTPPDLISGIITESGVLTPSAVSEELIKIWF
ncbi:translation initiation factor 2B, alpha subunit [Microthyrium microscopicum]|uniref:Translation initiation factor eIF2B subunit alpha n=1 Tax=Microthyrium microscopicum TaxID=703497 RepID=A0A6A6UKU6_9PEZI|nr:translation initiation factor 2B, alpha subunit [Microthyrium microscopicum]